MNKSPIIIGVILIYMATLFGKNSDNLSRNGTIGFTIVMLLQVFVYLFSDKIFKRKYWIYFIIQAIITFDYAVILSEGYETIVLGVVPLLVIQSMIVYDDIIKVIATAVFFYSIYGVTIIVYGGFKELTQSIPLLIIITIAIQSYSMFYIKQVKLRIQSQKVLKELELAYERVEELTLINERQRMARDLHDTLSQGLAGVIMQLEAVNANIKRNNIVRSQEIVKMSMEHARKTLADSRLVIDDLRIHTNSVINFNKTLENEISVFKSVSNAYITSDIRVVSNISPRVFKNIIYIIREALNNIAKHAEAKSVYIEIIEVNNQINISVRDDGIGFDVKLLDKMLGHYGILGMTERVKATNGKMVIKSKRKCGTNINIIIPIEKGIDE